MYHFVLFLHSWLRWVLLIFLAVVIIRFLYGWIQNKNFNQQDNRSTIFLIVLFHIQLLLGLMLYFILSPLIKGAFHDFGAAMKDNHLRYWAMEHIFIMVLSVVIAQIGRIKIKKAYSDRAKFRNGVIYFILAMVLIVSRVPWSEAGRMFRGF
jgi:heme A synthase